MRTKTYIEKAVIEFYKVSKEDLYNTSDNRYPLSAARSVYMYLLYASKVCKMYEIQAMFDYTSSRSVEIRIATVASSVRKGTDKLAEDVMIIQEKLNNKITKL